MLDFIFGAMKAWFSGYTRYKMLCIFFIAAVFQTAGLAQSKKEIIQSLSDRVDSLYAVIIQEKQKQIIIKGRADSLDNSLLEERSTRFAENKKCNEAAQKSKQELESMRSSIEELESTIESLESTIVKLNLIESNHKIRFDSLQKLYTALNRTYNSREGSAIRFPHPYGKRFIVSPNESFYNTTFMESQQRNYVIIDSAVMNLSASETLGFYFLIPVDEMEQSDCPGAYGFIAANGIGKEVYQTFWDVAPDGFFFGNCCPRVYSIKLKNGYRNFLAIASSGCGSGATSRYYEVLPKNGSLEFRTMFDDGAGWSDYHFYSDKDIYLNVERINPECHYSCPSKYKITVFDILTDKIVSSYFTKYMYDDFNDIGIEELISIIRKKEPSLLRENF